jgi:tetratricopeptide (TPR) repeat protein
MEEYTEAIDILESGLDRFPIEMEQIRGGQEVGRAQILALALMEDAFLELEEWDEVAEYAEQLLELEEIDNERNNTQVRNIDYRVDYALAMEELDRWEKAVDYWREAKAIADKMEGEEGQAAKFRATIHLARSYAAQGGDKVDHGYRIVAYYLFSDVKWLQQKSRADQVEKLFDDYFRDKWSDLSDYVMNLVETNLSLLRNPESKKVITGLVERHWPGQLGNLQKLIEEAEVELRTE